MSILNIHGSYFSITNPFQLLDRWFNPSRHHKTIVLDGHELTVYWTERAEKQFRKLSSPLVVEMQLYFSCVVKKRLIFHKHSELETLTINENLSILFRPVEALSCDPEEFAQHYPVKQQFTSSAAIKMHPKSLELDFKRGGWQGSFSI